MPSPTPTAPLPGDSSVPPAFAAAGPPREALAGFWPRLVAAFLDWILIGILAAAIGELFGVETPTPPSADGGVNLQFQAAPGPFILVELAYFTYFHATRAGQSMGNKIMGIRVLDADTGRSLPYARAFARALMSSLSALPCLLWVLLDVVGTPQGDLARHRRRQPGSQGQRLPARRVQPPCLLSAGRGLPSDRNRHAGVILWFCRG